MDRRHFIITSAASTVLAGTSLPVLESTTNTGTITVNVSILKNVLYSDAESEYGSLFHNAITEIPLIQALKDINHAQPTTPM